MFAVMDRSRHGRDVFSCVEGPDSGSVFEPMSAQNVNTFYSAVYFCHSPTAVVATFRIKLHRPLFTLSRMFYCFQNAFHSTM